MRKFVWIVLILLIAGGAGGLWWKKQETERHLKWDAIVMPERMARVTETWSAQTLAERLEKAHKIRDVPAFLEAAAQVGLKEVAQGGYSLPEKAGPLELAQVFKAGPTHRKITFPEGFTALQIAARLEKEGFASGGALKRAAYPPGEISPLEGRLFPDTYLLPLQSTEKQVVALMQERFQEVVKGLPAPLPSVNGRPLTLAQVVVLASLVERETPVDDERPKIAGVLLNRLRRPMRLQCDASVQYAGILAAMDAAAHKTTISYQDLKISSPFNTYQHDGLPPGPICNPGVKSLLAAAAPAPTDALFYVMSPLLNRHRFAATYSEHEHNVALYRRERAAQ